MTLEDRKAAYAKNNDVIDTDAIIDAYCESTTPYETLEALTTKELIATSAFLYSEGIETDYIDSNKSQKLAVYTVNKALVKYLT